MIPAQQQREGIRRHGDVWHALFAVLEKLKAEPGNGRLGLYGPDLYTQRGTSMVLFEIKAKGNSTSVQQAVGQLFIYEQMLQRKVRKVIVVPAEPSKNMQRILGNLRIRWICYGDHRTPTFDASELARMIG